MTKVYLIYASQVDKHKKLIGNRFVSRVFTNHKKARNYTKFMNKTSEDFYYWIITQEISNVDFGEIPY